MKKVLPLFVALLTLMSLGSCETKKEQASLSDMATSSDSLQQIINQKDMELNDMVSTLNEIQDGFRQINEAQGRITMERRADKGNRREAMLEDVRLIQQTMQLNRELVTNLRKQLKVSKLTNARLKITLENTIATLTTQLEDLNRQMTDLRQQLADKDVKIAAQGNEISTLKNNVSDLNSAAEVKDRTVAAQDRDLNTAYYVFGTKHELKEQNILSSGEVLRKADFNKDYFTKIDIRVEKVIRLYSKSAKLMTAHPADSYSLDRDDKNQYTLRITDPVRFWSVSKYLVITVK